MSKHLVSVIITTYKGSKSVYNAIESVLKQTYTNLEILVIDDNGLETEEQVKTQRIVESFNCESIKYFSHKKNKNGSAARNTGIAQSHGKYIALLDDDDIYYSDKIKKQVDILESKDERYAVCYTGMKISELGARDKIIIDHYSGDCSGLVLMRLLHAPSSVLMFRKDAAVAVGCFDESYERHQDWEFLDKISQKYFIAVVEEPCIERIICSRNSPQNANKYEKLRLFYLERLKKNFGNLSKKEEETIFSRHYYQIAKEYLKDKNLLKMNKYILKTKHPLLNYIKLIKDAINFKSRRTS